MTIPLDVLGPYALVILAGLFVHACFQLGLSMLTIINSHAIGHGSRHGTILKLSISYIAGALIATIGLLVLTTYFFRSVLPLDTNPVAWIIVCSLVICVGWLVLLFYYRKVKGTQLWLSRRFVERLTTRAKHTKTVIGSLAFGLMMVVVELPFLIAPLALAGAVLGTLPSIERTIGVLAYAVAANIPLIIVTVLLGGGHKISTIQRWRETNKQFLQWTSGMTLILLGIYLFAINIWGQAA